MNPAVSVIVPIFNSEQDLPRCLESILGQSIENMEVLLVIDQASSEESVQIADDFGKKDRRMRIIKPDVRGVSAVRNVGLRAAKGEYVGFVDSDDYIMPEMYADLYTFASKHALDIAVSGIFRDHANNEPLRTLVTYPEETISISNTTRRHFMYKWVLSSQANPVWNKLFKRSLLVKHDILFDETIRIGEDAVFNAHCFCTASTAGSVSRAYYAYVNRPSSVTYSVDEQVILRDFQSRWDVYRNCANQLTESEAFLAVCALRLIANAILIYKTRGQTLEAACSFAGHLISTLGLQPYLEAALRPDVLPDFARESRMDEAALANFNKFAEAAFRGKTTLLEWQQYYTNVIEKKGS